MEIVMGIMMVTMIGGMLGFHKMMGDHDHGKQEEVKQEKVLHEYGKDAPCFDKDCPAGTVPEKANSPTQDEK
mgnify:CR=1 FL=1